MRKIKTKQFLRILKGDDLEFRISPFAFSLDEPVSVSGLHLPNDLSFEDCDFNEVTLTNCEFSGDISIKNSSIRALTFRACKLRDVRISSTSIGDLGLHHSIHLKHLIIKACNINSIMVMSNPTFMTIHIGCENSLRDCVISNNGTAKEEFGYCNVFICPERFESMLLDNTTTDTLHIGTFGKFASFTVKSVRAEIVLIDGCSVDSSDVLFENVQPLEAERSALHFINTTFDQQLFGDKAFQNYSLIKNHRESVDIEALILG